MQDIYGFQLVPWKGCRVICFPIILEVPGNPRGSVNFEENNWFPLGFRGTWEQCKIYWFPNGSVERDAKMIGYFERLGVNKNVALGSLYSIAVLEVLIGLGFFYFLFARETRFDLVRITFKISMGIFSGFSIFDILCGDRTELWEHGTFLILATIHYVYILFGAPGEEFDKMRDRLYSKSS